MTDFFTLQSRGISPALRGKADGYSAALSPTLHNRKSHWGKVPNVKAPLIPRHCGGNSPAAGTINKLLPHSLARLFPGYPSRWGVDTNDWWLKIDRDN